MIGKTLGRYQIAELIGSGGMGEVYRARDDRLGRDVAVKVLPAGCIDCDEARQRFRKEALALSRLSHPNVGVVHDSGADGDTDYLVMEYIRGMDLDDRLRDGPLRTADIVGFADQLVEGLAAAHEAGVIHRDIKPANIRLTPEGRVKIVDFGVAKVAPVVNAGDDTVPVTRDGVVTGTVYYMSPEQLRGETIDARSDLFSVGVVLYEMATGKRPFSDPSGANVIDAILNRDPLAPSDLNPSIDPGLQRVILKALSKRREERYQTAAELRQDLVLLGGTDTVAVQAIAAANRGQRRLGLVAAVLAILLVGFVGYQFYNPSGSPGGSPTAEARTATVAVLPLTDNSAEKTAHFADGLTEALISGLVNIRSLRVISRNSVMQYRDETPTPAEVHEALGVDLVMTGSVTRSGDRVRVIVRLVEAPGGGILWSETYDEMLQDILDLQSKLARAVASKIRVQLSPAEVAALESPPRPADAEAVGCLMEGLHFGVVGHRKGLAEAVECFNKALEHDPELAPAHASIASAYMMQAYRGWTEDADEAFEMARRHAEKALGIAPGLPEARSALAMARLYFDLDWSTAESELRAVVDEHPSFLPAHKYLSLVLSAEGRHDDAIAEARIVEALDPTSGQGSVLLGTVLYYAGRYQDAVGYLERGVESEAEFSPAHVLLLRCQLQLGKPKEFAETAWGYERSQLATELPLQRFADITGKGLEPGTPTFSLNTGKALQGVQAQTGADQMGMAVLSCLSGEEDQAIEWLEQTYEENRPALLHIKVDPDLKVLQDNPRFQLLLQRMKLEDE